MAESRFKFDDDEFANPIVLEGSILTQLYNFDTHPDKLMMAVGAYRTDENKPWVLPVVHGAERRIAEDASLNHEYLPVLGLPAFRDACAELLLGKDSPSITENRVICAQAVGGTGALRIAGDFLKKNLDMDIVYVSDPSWPNHMGVFSSIGYSDIRKYRYWNGETRSLDITGMCEDIAMAPSNSVIILHACAHNPTGVDPTHEQWQMIAQACKESGAFVLMDTAYQGFSTGDLDKDAYSVRLFERNGFEFFIAQSFSKNFGLYNERVGNLAMIVNNTDVKAAVSVQMELVIRKTYSNPPNHGARVVATVLGNPSLFNEWKECVQKMANRILLMRKLLFEELKRLGTPGQWNHIITQTGMFSYTGLNERQVDHMLSNFHVYAMKSGRINMCGMTTKTVEHVASAIHDAVQKITKDY